MSKICPKCGQILIQPTAKGTPIRCRNGCDIYTAAPVGEGFTVRQRGAEEKDGLNLLVCGGMRREPTCKE